MSIANLNANTVDINLTHAVNVNSEHANLKLTFTGVGSLFTSPSLITVLNSGLSPYVPQKDGSNKIQIFEKGIYAFSIAVTNTNLLTNTTTYYLRLENLSGEPILYTAQLADFTAPGDYLLQGCCIVELDGNDLISIEMVNNSLGTGNFIGNLYITRLK